MTAKHILIVEDELILARNISRFLSNHGYSTTVSDCIGSAEDELRKTHVDIVLLDIELPDGNGLDAHTHMLQLSPQLYTIVMTGRFHPNLKERTKQLNIDHVLIKPFPLSELLEMVSKTTATVQSTSSKQINTTMVSTPVSALNANSVAAANY